MKMSRDVLKSFPLNDCIGNFTESAPRPPVPGEETLETSSTGGGTTSTRSSSGSYKSKGSSTTKTVTHVVRAESSPAATPRRSNLDKNVSMCSAVGGGDCDLEAPLGFEPEGSVSNSPPFTENTTPNYLKWAESLQFLLEDSDGVKLFKQFLDQEQCSNLLDFWFVCRGLQMHKPSDTVKIHSLVRVIYRRYIKGDLLSLPPDIKKNIIDRMKKDRIDQTIFDEAQREVENSMRNDTYPLFLKSDLYIQYIQTGGESPKASSTSSGSNSVRPVSGPLPVLTEGEEYKSDATFTKTPTSTSTIALTQTALLRTQYSRAARSTRRVEGETPDGTIHCETPRGSGRFKHPKCGMYPLHYTAQRPVNPYHISYAPVSTQDSELQSLSSDAQTDDTMSHTDSSVDGREHGGKKWGNKAQRKAMQRNAPLNRNTELNQQFIPRTERAPKDRNIAETEPEKFAAMLIEKLEKVKEESEKYDRIKESIKVCEMTDEEDFKSASFVHNVSHNASHNMSTTAHNVTVAGPHNKSMTSVTGSIQALMTTLNDTVDLDESNAQSILEEHCSRIWDNSTGQSPTRSPSRHSPKSWSPERGHRAGSSSRGGVPPPPQQQLGNLSFGTPMPTKGHHKRKPTDTNHLSSTLSCDSGVGGDNDTNKGVYYDGESHHRHIHHYHHYPGSKDKKHASDMDAMRRSMAYYNSEPQLRGAPTDSASWDDTVRSRSRDTSKRSQPTPKKSSDTCSNIDSGVSLMSSHTAQTVPNLHDPTNEKVMAWMLENEKMAGTSTTQYSTDSSDKGSSHKHDKRSHKSFSSQSSQQRHSSSGKKGGSSGGFNTSSRSGSLDRSGLHHHSLDSYALMATGAGGDLSGSLLPQQPIVQDPSMPLLDPPNPTTQLEEAKRRLEDETKARMLKSKSFTGSSSKDRERMRMPPPSFLPPARSLGPSKPLPHPQPSGVLDLSSEEARSDKRASANKRASSVPTTPSVGEVTVVGYYFCEEPIPYRCTIPGRNVTLAQFKQLITKRGFYKYFFKSRSDEFDSGVVMEEVTDDNQVLPLWDDKVVGKVERIE